MKRIFLFLLLGGFLCACQPDEKVYLYEVNPVEVTQDGVEKNNLKSELEFVSLAYADLFGETLPNATLTSMVQAYASLGDKSLVADILIRNMLNSPGADVPSDSEMRADLPTFIRETYKKFYVREPSEYELWYFQNLITTETQLTPELIYYAFLSSDEYRYY